MGIYVTVMGEKEWSLDKIQKRSQSTGMREETFFCFLGYGGKKKKNGVTSFSLLFSWLYKCGGFGTWGGLNNGNGHDIMFGFVCMKK